jgi:hypothetical protein
MRSVAVWVVGLVAIALSGCSKKTQPKPTDDFEANDSLWSSFEAYCDEGEPDAGKPALVAGAGTYDPAAPRHGIVAVERFSNTSWSIGGPGRPAGRGAPTDKAKIEAVACADRTFVHTLENCSYNDERGLGRSVQRGRGVAKIRFFDARTGALILETSVEATKDPPPCPSVMSADDPNPVTHVEDEAVDAVLERFRTGQLNASTKSPQK